ncbi:hypothetical protein GQ53DRAFT_330311 [Thozetella sp. PMI_491]|nr:hypothetical protein GQ53DRAFT_330311 [Thozetella sp. PMI_491]
MDLLATPPNSIIPVEKAPYVCKEGWDGGSFFGYARRKGRLRSLPPNLAQFHSDVASADDIAAGGGFLEPLYPTPQEEQQELFQAWFFFGLLAEFLGLNETSTGQRVVQLDTAAQELATLHADYTYEFDGERYLRGAKLLEPETAVAIMTRLKAHEPDLVERLAHLHRCLLFTAHMLATGIHTDFDLTIRCSISALGELFSTAITTASSLGRLPKGIPVFGFYWNANFITEGGPVESAMLEKGWCISEIEKIKLLSQGLSTLHFVSRLTKERPYGDHQKCTKNGCIAFQLDIETYRPSHALNECCCESLFVDVAAVTNILETTSTYPVLRVLAPVEGQTDQNTQLSLEPYEAGVPYVAISHVWADGMGNPTENALPQCQIEKVARLVRELERDVEKSDDADKAPEYRIWIDPLLCPVELEGKKIALQRIPDVYRDAKHVLVLDASIMRYRAKELSTAEVLLRMFSCSAWMRRLWTLQEGALAKSLYFQFADGAVSVMEPLERLFREGLLDLRIMRVWMDVSSEVVNLGGWFNQHPELSKPTLVNLQSSLYFRTVSNPSDEPLCIATLLRLGLKYIIEVSDGQERMSRVWELISKSLNGLPAGIIFSSDETLDLPGWRWAPKSFLGANADPHGVMGISDRFTRLRTIRRPLPKEEKGNQSLEAQQDVISGIPTPLGLRVEFAGFRLRTKPRLPGLPILPWDGLIVKAREDMLMAKEQSTGQWMKVVDYYRSRKLATWSLEERRAYDTEANNPLSRAIQDGRCAIIYDSSWSNGDTFHGLLVELDDEPGAPEQAGHPSALLARRIRLLVVDKTASSYDLVWDVVQGLANRVAEHESTQALLRIAGEDRNGQEYQDALDKVREAMKELMAEAWATQPAFVQAVHDNIGPDMEEYMWATIPKSFSHDIVAEDIPSTQVWIVD